MQASDGMTKSGRIFAAVFCALVVFGLLGALLGAFLIKLLGGAYQQSLFSAALFLPSLLTGFVYTVSLILLVPRAVEHVEKKSPTSAVIWFGGVLAAICSLPGMFMLFAGYGVLGAEFMEGEVLPPVVLALVAAGLGTRFGPWVIKNMLPALEPKH